MEITVWYSTESMADYIIDHTVLKRHHCVKAMLQESDASKPKGFHAVPDHIKKILYLDAPDIIVEVDSNPIFTALLRFVKKSIGDFGQSTSPGLIAI